MNLDKIKRAGIVTIPSLFTIGNIGCGFFSILCSVSGNFSKAGWLILIAMFLDGFDGRVARMLKAESAFGVEMDSLADLISFCTAPALLIYFFALKEIPVWGQAIACMFVLFGAIRLAKFNVLAHSGKGSKKYFSGLPTPAAALVIVSFVLSYNIFAYDANGHILPFMKVLLPYVYSAIAFITIGLALLMVSTIPYAAFKEKRNPSEKRKGFVGRLVLIAIVLFLFFKYPQDVIFIVFGLYALMGIIMVFVRAFIKREDK